ncbi:MAG: SPOR domain-containing protein [Balneolaceae bacterium]|nr:SPOR domain-containing protein [Balneolaceae bacterium]
MASRRILITMQKTGFLLFFFFCMLIVSCSSTEYIPGTQPDAEEKDHTGEVNTSPSNLDLSNFRTLLSDLYTSRKNEIPEHFTQQRTINDEVEQNIYEGFRIQIFSGESVVKADTIAKHFRIWADSTIVGYNPETYVFFKTPYYRVHVGDFHDREKADAFSGIVKRYFRDAWVVYDRVNPNHVPADTTRIRTK